MGCFNCGRGFHDECTTECDSCHPDLVKEAKKQLGLGKSIGAPIKDDADVNDPYSTGRKRAAIKFPLYRTNPCEWRGKKNCGGGLNPIVGCITGLQEHRHHGPIKDPLHNERGNVHRICTFCHNRWHELNNHVYDEMRFAEMPHSPVAATELELLENEAFWRIR